jgi:hypothetical protein
MLARLGAMRRAWAVWVAHSVTRSSDGGSYLEAFLVSAVVAAIAVRSLLAVAGFPRVETGELHIAHVFWGGLLMLLAVATFVLFVDRWLHHLAAILGGLGFGIFIDELGKFITRNNDYFFQPAIALIYVIFVGLFLVLRVVLSAPSLTDRERLANAMALLTSGLDGTIDPRTRARVVELLRESPRGPLTNELRAYAANLADQPSILPWGTPTVDLDALYARAVSNRWFGIAVVVVVGAYAVGSLIDVGLVILTESGIGSDAASAQALATLAGSLLVVRGLPELWRSRLAAYRWFLRGVVVWILVAQPFVFYSSQLAGLGGLALDVAAYVVVRSLAARERIALERGLRLTASAGRD